MSSLSSNATSVSGAWDSLQPKNETGAYQFIQETKHNGENVVVAILDTGVDPGVAGLLKCPNGKPKVIDIIDCTGAGDVDTKTEVEATTTTSSSLLNDKSVLNTVVGLSGRTLSLNDDWVNPSGKWHLGIKRAYELFPTLLTKRIKEDRKKDWASKIHNAQVELKKQKQLLEAGGGAGGENNNNNQKQSKDLEERLEVLNSIDKSYDDPGPIYDVIVWNDGSEWFACVDSSETGDMSQSKALRSYKVAQEYGTFSDKDNLNYCVTIFDEGNVCSICSDVGAHG
jgi:tripeptidyl-peptidase II